MATIAENLQTLKDSTDAIKQAIIDKGGNITGDITTWADAINGISGSDAVRELKIVTISNSTKVYEDGMTWGEFMNSIYNIQDSLYGTLYKTIDNSIGFSKVAGTILIPPYKQVYASDIIDNLTEYYISSGSSGGGSN